MNPPPNRRILLVDDTPAIHEDFRKILADASETTELDADEALLFGTPARAVATQFELDSAFQGKDARDKVHSAVEAGRPYAMAFVDMRMPPGWDGVETVEHLWQVDPELQIVLCTAYSDYSWTEVLSRLEVRDRLLILKKPFDAIEVYQLASALTAKWEKTRQAGLKMNQLEQLVEERTRELSDANIIVRNSPVILYRLRGEPAFPLIYISHNIRKFNFEPADLMAEPTWSNALVHPEDRSKVNDAMARILDRNAEGSSIEFRLHTADGECRWVDNRYIPIRDKDGRLVEVEGIIIDITERKAAEEKIAYMARTDGLTGLANRATFLERLRNAFAAAQRGATPFAIFYIDLDHFKQVNDTLGHPVGDQLLHEVASRLKAATRSTDLLARLGGDEFAIIQGEMGEPTNAGALAAKLLAELSLPYQIGEHELRVSISIGICPYTGDCASPDAMLAQADMALYRSKEEGRDRYHFHSDELDREVLDRTALALDLKGAIEHGQLELFYQPQIELSGAQIVGMEALVRWHHPIRGTLAAAEFIPIAEKSGIVVALGNWVLDQACRQVREWRGDGLVIPVMTINMSLLQLKNGPGLIRSLRETLARWDLEPSDLEFDVTEATLAQLTWSRNDVLPQLRELGVRIAIDDFGSEYSSFEYVRAYRVNNLKLAQVYVDRSTEDAETAATIRTIMNFARDVGIGVIAQGVETEQQRALLASMISSTRAQGFRFSEAVDAERAAALLRLGHVGNDEQKCAGD